MKPHVAFRFALLGFALNVAVSLHAASVIKLEFAAYQTREDAANVVIGVLRGGEVDQAVTVDYATASLTATAGTDFAETTGTVAFAPGEKLKLVSIPILNDALKEPKETFRFGMSNPTGGGVLGTPTTATVTILDNDPGAGFATAKYFIHEDEGALQVTVRRGNDRAMEPFTVDYATVDGTALAGEDYVATSGTLAFAAGELSRSFVVPLINDGLPEADENFRAVLSNVSGDASLSAATNLTGTLCDATGQTPQGFATIHREADGAVKLAFTGGVSKRFQPFFDLYPLEVSTNLVDWQPLALLSRTNSAINDLTFNDPAADATRRFYRVPTNHFIAPYPKPTGPYPVGRIDRLVTDPDRRNRYGISTNGSFAISVWYPAVSVAGQQPARWFEAVVARDTSPTSTWTYYDETRWLDRVPYFWTYAINEAPLAEVSGLLPIVLYSPGYSSDRRQESEKLEGLASYGYVVVAVDHDDSCNTVWPDGFYHTQPAPPGNQNARVRDLTVILEALASWNQNDPRFAGRLGLDAFGAIGFSFGGLAVVQLAQQDVRCKAVVLLDPNTAGSLQRFSTPSLTMHNPTDGEQSVFAASNANAIWFQISNTDHFSFATHMLYGSRPAAANREAARTIEAYAFSFFNKWLKGQDDHLHESASGEFPRVVNFKKK